MLSDSFSMVELAVPDSWINHNLEELNLRKKYEINVIAIKKGETICVNIHPEENLCMGEILILAGENKALAKLMKKYKENVVLYFGETPFFAVKVNSIKREEILDFYKKLLTDLIKNSRKK